MGSGKSRAGATRRAVLVAGGVTLLASIWRQPSGHPAVATQVGNGGGNRSQTIAALKIVLPRLLDNGYHFTTP